MVPEPADDYPVIFGYDQGIRISKKVIGFGGGGGGRVKVAN
jgi:hypothetical protein